MSNFSIKAIEVHIELDTKPDRPQDKGGLESVKSEKSENRPEIDEKIIGLPCSVTVTKVGAPTRDTATIEIWGLSIAHMKRLTSLSYSPQDLQCNHISIMAGEERGSLACIFKGEISSAKMDFSGAPNVKLVIKAETGFYAMKKKLDATSFSGKVAFVELMEKLATDAGFTKYRNESVTVMVDTPHFTGSPWIQIMQLANQYGVDLYLDNNVLTTVPKGVPRSSYPVQKGAKGLPVLFPLVLSPETGLTGYPAITDNGTEIIALLQPSIILGSIVIVYGSIVESVIFGWATKIVHSFAAHNAPGKSDWFSTITLQRTPPDQNLFPKQAWEIAIEEALKKYGIKKSVSA